MQKSKLYKLLNEPSTSKSKATCEQVYEKTSDMELYYKTADIERQVIDIETSVSAHVIEKRPVVQNEPISALETCQVAPKRRKVTEKHNVSQEVQVISDDDDDVVHIKTETIPITFEEIDDEQTGSGGDDDVIDHISDNEIILIDGSSIFRTPISIDNSGKEVPVKEEPEDNSVCIIINILKCVFFFIYYIL